MRRIPPLAAAEVLSAVVVALVQVKYVSTSFRVV